MAKLQSPKKHESIESEMHSYRRQHVFGAGFILFGILLALFVPESGYVEYGWLRNSVDSVTHIVPSIDEFARVSDFPGTTRVVMAILWALVMPMVVLFDRLRNFINREESNVDAGPLNKLGWRIWIVLAFMFFLAFVWPVIFTIDAEDMTSNLTADRFIQWVSHSRFALGLVTSLYCLVEAFFIYGLYRFLKFKFFGK